MHHANLSSAAAAAKQISGESRLTTMRARSPRAETALREIANLQAQVVRLAAIIESDGDAEPDHASGQTCSDDYVRGILQARLERNSFFPAELFSDPAWDMMLDLYAAELGQLRVSVTSLCIASNAPTSTALRWISTLEQQGLIERRADPLDGRRFFLSLTRQAIDSFEHYFAALGNRTVI